MPIVTKQKKWGPEYVQAAEPVKVRDGMTWYDTTNNELKVWDESSSSWRWAATGSGARFGYICGGGFTTYFTGIQRIDFPFDTAVALQVGNIETSKNTYCTGCNSSEYGYIMGGHHNTSNSLTSIRRFDFPFQSGIALIVGEMASDKHGGSGCNSSQHGFSIAGNTNITYFSSVDRILFPFSSGTADHVGNILGSRSETSSSNSSQYGYTMGGQFDYITSYSYVERITFPFNSGTSTHNSILGRQGWFSGSFNSSQYSYTFCQNPGVINSYVDRFLFPFNSGTATVNGRLSTTTDYANGLNSTQKGYVIGGMNSTGDIVHIQELQFPFDSGTAENRGVMSSKQIRPTCIDGVDFVTQFI